MFQGFVELETADFPVVDLVKGASGVPTNADALPTWRVYGPDGFVPGQAGTMGFRDSGTVTGATNASPIVVTSASHGLSTGDRVTVAGVGGNAAANGTFTVTKASDDTFSLDGTSGGGGYTAGGGWNVTGLYTADIDALAANGYAAGERYDLLVTGAVGGSAYGSVHTFQVS